MDKDEIIEALLKLNIIQEIAGMYFITEKYKELLQETKKVNTEPKKVKHDINHEALIEGSGTLASKWPGDIATTKGRARVVALFNACAIPKKHKSGYRVWAITNDVIRIVSNIVEEEAIIPDVFVRCLTDYYAKTDMPLGTKNLFSDGVILDIYEEYLVGDYIKANDESKKDNTTWR
jgi:hypothetical protein